MSKRETKTKVREIWRSMFEHIPDEDDALRAAHVRSLCPCSKAWSVPLWDIVFAACEDASHLVRIEALHVIEDAITGGHLKECRGMDRLFAARKDPHPEVRRFVEDLLGQWSKRENRRQRATRMHKEKPVSTGRWKSAWSYQQARAHPDA